MEALFGPEWARALFCFILILPALGFVRAPFARWTRGTVTGIDAANGSFVVSESATGKHWVVHWNGETRWWTEPNARRDKGVKFEPSALQAGAEVRVLFKERAKKNLAERIIRVSADSATQRKS